MKRLMFAAPYVQLFKRVQGMLGDDYCTYVCDEKEDVLSQINEFKPDILVLNVMGSVQMRLQMLRMLCNAAAPVKVIVLSGYMDEQLLRNLSVCDVFGVLTVPCRAELVAAYIRDAEFALDHPENDSWCLENEIDKLLMDLSFRRGPARYQCVFESIRARYMNMECSMKELYIDVAKCCGGNYQRVEKAVRDAIADAYENADARIWAAYFPADRKRDKPYPGNEDFIACIAGCLVRRARVVKPFFRTEEKVR